MNSQKTHLLRTICGHLKLDEIPTSMVSRRLTIFKSFEENKEAFLDPSFIKYFREVQGKGKDSKMSASTVFSFINENRDLWEEVKKKLLVEEEKTLQEEVPLKIAEKYIEINRRNKFQHKPPLITAILSKLLENAQTEKISYPNFEKNVLYHLERITSGDLIDSQELFKEASKAFVWTVYKEDPLTVQEFLFEEFSQDLQAFEKLGLFFSYPEIPGRGKSVSRIMNAVHLAASTLSSGVFELRRLMSIVNKIGAVSFTENEIILFFKSYLDGNLDKILLNPPKGVSSYCKEVSSTHDFDFTINFNRLVPNVECIPKELEGLFIKFINILTRLKIVKWSKNAPKGEEVKIIGLMTEIQKKVLNLIDENEDPLSLEEMFEQTDLNVIESTVEYFSEKLAYKYMLRLRKGGIGRAVLDSFKMMNIAGASKTIGNQILDIRKYYEALYPDSWQKSFYYDFLLNMASKGLSSSPKQPVRERLKLLIQEDPKIKKIHSSAHSKKIKSNIIFEALKSNIPLLPADFKTAEEAQEYFSRVFHIIRSVLNKVWIKKILRSGYELYIETPVTRGWTDEMDDLTRELVRYYQIHKQSSKIHELIFESLREALRGIYINEELRDREVFGILLKLPENPLIDPESAEKYLETAYTRGKDIINKVLGREVEEVERITFDQEIGKRISLENRVIDWFVRASHYYDPIITETISLEKTADSNDVLRKTVYGGIIFLIEESMKSLRLNQNDKMNKADFLRDLLLKQVEALRSAFSELKFDYNIQTIIDYLLVQIELWDRVFGLRAIITNLEANNRIKKAIKATNILEDKDTRKLEISNSLIEEPGIRGMIAREIITDWIRIWANSVINLAESYLEEVLSSIEEEKQEEFEQEVLELLFDGTGRNDIRNFMVPFIIGNLKEPSGFATSSLLSEFMDYSHDVFAEAVRCDSQLSIYFLYLNWPDIEQGKEQYKRELIGLLDFIVYQESQIESCRELIDYRQEFNLSDVVKKATGLSLSGLTLQTVVFQLGENEIFSAASYTENPFEGSVVTGLTLELISKETTIPMGLIHPLASNAAQTIAGLIERNQSNAFRPDLLLKVVLQQLLEEAKLLLLRDSGTLQEKMPKKMINQTEEARNISRCNLKITTAYKMQLKQIDEDIFLIPEEVEFYGEKLENFALVIQLIIPFFEPSKIIKERLMNDYKLKDYLKITDEEKLQVFPSLVVFDDNGQYKVVFGAYTWPNTLYLVIAEENDDSKMGLRTIQYLLKTRDFEEFAKDSGLFSLPELNRSLPLNKIRVIKEKRGDFIIDFELIKNIALGAI